MSVKMNSLHVVPIIGFFSIILVSLFEGLLNASDLTKPQSKEAAIVMLADCVEAAVKSLSVEEKNIVSIQQKIQKVTQTVFLSGQLNESPLLFKELCIIEASFLKVYNGMYHERIKYEREL